MSGRGRRSTPFSDLRIRRAAALAAFLVLFGGLLPPAYAAVTRVTINEVLADPGPGGHQWVELYNAEAVGVNVTGWMVSDEDTLDYLLPAIPDMPPGARIRIHLTAGPDDAAFSGGVLNLYANVDGGLDPSDQVALYASSVKSPTSIMDFVSWQSGGAAVTCGQPFLLSRAGDLAFETGLALAPYGSTLHAVWASNDPVITTGTDEDLVGRALVAGNWGNFDEVNLPGDAETQQDVALAEHDGLLYAAWATYSSSSRTYGVNYSVHNGTRWSDELPLEAGATGVYPRDLVAASYAGRLFVIWTQWDSPTGLEDVVYRTFDGQNWSSLQYLSNAGDPARESAPEAVVHEGLLYVFYSRTNGTMNNSTSLGYRTFDGASWSAFRSAVDSPGDATGGLTEYAAASFGASLHLVFSGYVEVGNGSWSYGIHERVLTDSAWGPIQTIAPSSPGTSSQDYEPAIAATASTLYVAWTRYGMAPPLYQNEVMVRTFDGATWGPEAVVANDTAADHTPVLAVVGQAAYVGWETTDNLTGNDADVKVCRLQGAASLYDDENAVLAGIWTAGDLVDTTGMARNLTLYRVADGSDTDTPADWSFVDRIAPNAVATGTMTVQEDHVAYFIGSSSFDNLAVVAYLWDADDSDGLDWLAPDMYGPVVDWVYTVPGLYTATLRVEDAAGNWDLATVTVYVVANTSNPGPYVLNFSVSAPTVFRRDAVVLTTNATDSPDPESNLTVQYAWRQRGGLLWRQGIGFGNTTYVGFPSPQGFFQATYTPGPNDPIGKYSLRVRVRDTGGSWSAWFTLFEVLTVVSDLPTADAGPDLFVNEDTNLTLDGSGSTDNVAVLYFMWDFGDGKSSLWTPSASAVHVWDTPGSYMVTLTVMDGDGNLDTDVALVTVLDVTPPQAAITASPGVIDEDHGVTFSGSGSRDNVGVVRFEWDFGDRNTSVTASPLVLHAYDDPGNYTVFLTVFDAAGTPATANITITVNDVITVNDDGGEDYTEIQPAVDNATDNAKIFVHSGSYPGNVTIDRRVRLEGAGRDIVFVGDLSAANGTVYNLTAAANGTTITGFTLRGGQTCLFLDRTEGVRFTQNRIEGCRYGLFASYTTNTYVAFNILTKGEIGIVADHSDDDAYRWNEISYYTRYGAKSYDAQLVNCFNWNEFHHNAVAYFYDPTGPLRPLLFDGNELWENGVGLQVLDADTIIVSNNTFRDNGVAVNLTNASPEIFSNRFEGTGLSLECDRSAAYVHDNDFTATAATVRCTAADGFRFEGNAGEGASLSFEDSLVDTVRFAANTETGQVSFLSSRVTNLTLERSTLARFSWRLVVNVTDRLGRPVENATVFVEDNTGRPVASAVTAADGRTPPMTLEARRMTRGGSTEFAPFTVTAAIDGFSTATTVDLGGDVLLPITLTGYPPIVPATTQPEPFPGLAVAAIASLLFAAGIGIGGLTSSEVGKYHLWLFFLPLYTRLNKDEILDQPTRFKLLGFISGNPGAHFALIGQRLELAHGQLAYHLDILTREGHIFARSDGFKKRFYPADTPIEIAEQYVMSDVQEKLAEVISGNPGITRKGLSAALSVSRQVVAYHLEKLEAVSKVRHVGEGRSAQYYLMDPGAGWVGSAPVNGRL